MDVVSKFAVAGVLFVLTLAFGLWLSHAGKPYNGLLFNAHKLLALAAVVVAAWQARDELALAGPQARFILLLVLAGVSIVALFATGALMSIGKGEQATFLKVHKAAIVLAVIIWLLAIIAFQSVYQIPGSSR
jgi:hypothetical protein